MAINQNHLFEELNGVKCAIVEKNVPPARVAFLRGILEHNGFTVVVAPSPPPKAAAGVQAGVQGSVSAGVPAGVPGGVSGVVQGGVQGGVPAQVSLGALADVPGPRVGAGSEAAGAAMNPAPAAPVVPPPETFTVGVTDVMFNPINAIFGRLLKAPGGHVVTLAYWKQQDALPDDERPYFQGK